MVDFDKYIPIARKNAIGEEKEKEIIAEYKRGRTLFPKASNSQIMKAIAQDYGYKSYYSVKYILKKHGEYDCGRTKRAAKRTLHNSRSSKDAANS